MVHLVFLVGTRDTNRVTRYRMRAACCCWLLLVVDVVPSVVVVVVIVGGNVRLIGEESTEFWVGCVVERNFLLCW